MSDSPSPLAIRTIHRSDYQPPDWLVETVHLDFDLSLDATTVSATLGIRRNGSHDRPLRLDEDGAIPEVIRVDGKAVAYTRDSGQLILPVGSETATVTFTTTIDPSANTQLMGLFASNGMLCTQCEAEGFRRIIPFVDRPDNMAVYTVRMEADRAAFPILLANGEKVAEGDLDDGRHFAEWHDRWPKPSYLFALVAGQLVANRDSFTTASGMDVDLAIWVRDGDLDRTGHAMQALKNSMRWDEQVYGREYDLPVFNIVAVSDFNMGAMENKGLNIFNSRYILADADTASDLDFDGVEGVVAHEYFHNWSGNRVTCRDWFQLSLKEGFTVYRDQCFSADMGSEAVKRIEDVRILRAAQFPEDNGPLAHPIRPDSYQEISNFYTATVYNKGAEVIRMMATMVGPKRFRAGTDLYFDRHDGEAATCEDFVRAIEEGAGINLSQFRLWYSQAGTPHVTARVEHDDASGTAALHLTQTIPATPGQPDKQPMLIPLRIAAHDRAKNAPGSEQLVLLGEAEASVSLGRFSEPPVLSFNRGFSAPIIAEVARNPGDLAWLAAHDDDPFARYEALQALMLDTLVARVSGGDASHDAVVAAVGNTLASWASDPAFVAEACALPSEAFVGDQMLVVDPDAIRRERRALQRSIGQTHEALLRTIHAGTATNATELSPTAKGMRKLHSLALMLLWASDAADAPALAFAQFAQAGGMTDRQAALGILAHMDAPERQTALDAFYARYHDNQLVLDKWFTTQAFSLRADTPEVVAALAQHPDFTLGNPNRVRSLYGAFAGNQASFHDASGRGYALLADLVIALDPKNPQTAARMIPPLGRWKRFDESRARLMREALERILETPDLSRDVTEQASKSLAG
ncbi:aminopeptidase N [Sphingomonas lacunae]|uniref:Aminopeptidase N n=1 Tax=Sphingomonas lacunae TaxID=2698828 RepID=A0A6M4ASU5_9SPHN|nr:aminopeptidase N [Sphingomonas lacunae]QJQ31490.1 aminopeptidase N [Sphingomonas lacunae]